MDYPLIRDNRGRAPTYVIVDDDDGNAVLLNQFNRRTEKIGPRPYDLEEVKRAARNLEQRDKGWRAEVKAANTRGKPV